MLRLVLGALLVLVPSQPASAQDAVPASAAGPVIDTIIVITDNWFSPAEVQENPALRWANGIRFKTRPYVIRRELLFKQGQRFDLLTLQETARNLRARGLFSLVEMDTVRTDDGKFAVVVRTRDAWSTQLQLNGSLTGGTFTWAVGLTETNFLGTGDLVSLTYRKGVDRNTLTLGGRMNRVLGTRVRAEGAYLNFSDGESGVWRVGVPFASLTERYSIEGFGEVGNHQVLQFRARSLLDADTTRYWRRVFRNGIVAQYAPIATNTHYLRVGTALQLRREEYILVADTSMAVPDSLTGLIEVFVESRRANFRVVNYFNGFGVDEDVDLSTLVRVTGRLALDAFGYESNGVGGGLFISSGLAIPRGYVRGSFNVHGLYDAGGLDSGRVSISGTLAVKPAVRHATFLFATGGVQKDPPPGQEFDLGHGRGPRSFGPHAFTGTRNVWGTFEHRWFIWDDLLGTLGLGLAGFVDYGGAWYPDQAARYGGNAGMGLRFAGNRQAGVRTTRIDLGYRFGEGFGKRWALSVGRGHSF